MRANIARSSEYNNEASKAWRSALGKDRTALFMSMTETVKLITADERQGRLARLQASMPSHELDAVIVTPGANMRYFFGLTWRETERLVCAVISGSTVVFVCPKFEDTALLAALSSPVDCVWWEEHEDPRLAVANVLAEGSFSGIGIDPNCSFRQVHALSRQHSRH